MLGLVGGMLSFSTAKVSQAAMNGTNSNKVAMEAQSIAQSDADLLRATNYTDLSASTRKVATNTNFQHEVILSSEKNYTNTIKERTATINVYKGQETIPRATMHVTRYSTEKEFSGVPVGTVIAWPGAKAPTTNGVWLECNGQSCASYPALVAVLGKNTVPDYRNRFLESDTTAGTVKEAGLPNIRGSLVTYDNGDATRGMSNGSTGAFSSFSEVWYHVSLSNSDTILHFDTTGSLAGDLQKFYSVAKSHGYSTANLVDAEVSTRFSASFYSDIYQDNVKTVQPPSVTVRRFIKAS